MIGIAVMTALCVAGVAFYLRFLVALCSERRYIRVTYLVRIRSSPSEVSVIAQEREKAIMARAA